MAFERINLTSQSPPKRPPIVFVHQPLWYLLTPCFLLRQLLQLYESTENIEGDHDAPDPAAEGTFQMEYFLLAVLPKFGSVTNITCNNIGHCGYCLII